MKKNLFVVGMLATFSLVKSQVGINTTTPTATLDVTAKNSTGTGTTVEGLLIPGRTDKSSEHDRSSGINPYLCKQYCYRYCYGYYF